MKKAAEPAAEFRVEFRAIDHVETTLYDPDRERWEPGVAEEIEDLKAESLRMEQRKYEAADRKYHIARSFGVEEMRAQYVDKLSRRRPPRKPKKP